MLIATGCALALAASSPATAAAVNRMLPPIVITVSADSNVSREVVRLAKAEADAIFRATGIRFVWRDGAASPASTLVVSIDNETGPDRDNGNTPLGWLMFENDAPTPKIHLSYPNAVRYMEGSREVIGIVHTKTVAERDTLLGRLIGRALAHELGHYLLGSKTHTSRGLLKSSPTAQEFFSTTRGAFAIDPDEQNRMATRLSRPLDLAQFIARP